MVEDSTGGSSVRVECMHACSCSIPLTPSWNLLRDWDLLKKVSFLGEIRGDHLMERELACAKSRVNFTLKAEFVFLHIRTYNSGNNWKGCWGRRMKGDILCLERTSNWRVHEKSQGVKHSFEFVHQILEPSKLSKFVAMSLQQPTMDSTQRRNVKSRIQTRTHSFSRQDKAFFRQCCPKRPEFNIRQLVCWYLSRKWVFFKML